MDAEISLTEILLQTERQTNGQTDGWKDRDGKTDRQKDKGKTVYLL